eukprot:TRINITY_DN1394_c0_g1_i1.p1 TRINITY_DN1394_c0_g1~~TRINITY_DN1394_c0_g1_i1.p1  ORF type:complete len:175 (+),score=38.33 TRINITY_DN1394_c0_g1_i1:61-525(+)
MATWVQHKKSENIPSNALIGGHEQDGTPLYVIRSKHENSVQPGKFNPKHTDAYIGFAGKEIGKSEFEILVLEAKDFVRARWVPVSQNQGDLLGRAFVSGFDINQEPLYVARAKVSGSVAVGKTGKHLAGASVPFNGEEKKVKKFEVLMFEDVQE